MVVECSAPCLHLACCGAAPLGCHVKRRDARLSMRISGSCYGYLLQLPLNNERRYYRIKRLKSRGDACNSHSRVQHQHHTQSNRLKERRG
jgi:hypothetical protein